MFRTAYWLLLTGLLAAPVVQTQQTASPKKNPDAVETEIRFTDESVIRVFVLQEQIDVITQFGKLVVPLKNIQRIDFGVHLPEGLDQKVVSTIGQLGNENYKLREAALRDLVGWGPFAYPLVYRATRAEEPEVAKRAGIALDKIRAKHPAGKLRLREDDIIVTTKFTIIGRIVTPLFKTSSDNFGDMGVALFKLRSLRCLNNLLETELVLDAEKYGSASNQWLDTGIELLTDGRLVIVASGAVNLWPQGGNTPTYMSTPKGFKGGANGPFLAGTLIGKIGEDGPPFTIGERYEGLPTREGKLYLHIVPSPWNNASAGSYQVTVTPRSENAAENTTANANTSFPTAK
jgi:hypothetical protein